VEHLLRSKVTNVMWLRMMHSWCSNIMMLWRWNTPAEPVKPDIQAILASLGAMYSLCQYNHSQLLTHWEWRKLRF